MLMQTFVAGTTEEAKRIAEPHAIWYHDFFQQVLPGAPGKKIHEGYQLYDTVRQNHAKVTYDDLAEWGSAFGTPDDVADRIVTYAEAPGVSHWMAEMKFGGMSHEDTMASMRLFAKEVMPQVKERLNAAQAA
jgi:alkanesulfonate monooxygenase SsuD/methylene tetrahydromethanopterin reductase-like flavin-dependent oxidoreductase (luciferase family)